MYRNKKKVSNANEICALPVPVEDPTLREMAEYFSDANREELMEKVPGNRPVTVIVYHNGDQLNFFRVVDRDSASPLSDSIRYNLLWNKYHLTCPWPV